MLLEWSSRSVADRERIYVYYWNAASERIADEIDHAIANRARAIAQLEVTHRPGKGNTRECVMRRFPFTIIYRIEARKVRIVRVLHQAREYFNR